MNIVNKRINAIFITFQDLQSSENICPRNWNGNKSTTTLEYFVVSLPIMRKKINNISSIRYGTVVEIMMKELYEKIKKKNIVNRRLFFKK